MVMVQTCVLTMAEILIGLSIANKNAVFAGLIEISYPVFILLFAYLLFNENSLNLSILAGGTFVFIGVFIIFYFNS